MAYYPFNGNANDESGNGNDGTVYGAKLTEDPFGQDNKAYSFDGDNDYIDIGDIYVINGEELTVSLWINFKDVTYDNQFLTNGFVDDDDPHYFCLTYNNDGTRKIRMITRDDTAASNFYSANTYTTGTWYHVVFTRSGGEGTIYIDGDLENTGTVQSGDIGDYHNWYIGIGKNYTSGSFTGQIDEVRIYNRALSEEEIQTLANQ